MEQTSPPAKVASTEGFGVTATKAFDIGFVPQGWKRGNNLRFMSPGPNALGQVWQDVPVFPSEIHGDDVACVTFTTDDLQRVKAWWRWWQGMTPNVEVSRRLGEGNV